MPFVVLALLVCSSLMCAGTVRGKVTYTGTPARPHPIDMSTDLNCAGQHTTPATTETVVTGADNTLENVVVYVSSGAPDDGQVPAQAVRYDQKGCVFIPHVLAMHTDQEFKIFNSDPTLHSIHPMPRINQEWNKTQAAGAPPLVAKYDKPEFIPVKCNIHAWMHGYFVVLRTNHYDISKGAGDFKLSDLPPGRYTITAWQEDYGTQTADVTITGNETKEVNFSFEAKAY